MFAQDHNAKIYVANTAGVQIFNGFNWTTIVLPSQPIVRSVYFAADSTVYCGAYESFGRIENTVNTQPRYVEISGEIEKEEIANQEIWNIFECDSNLIFQSFSNIYRQSKQGLENIIPPTNIMFGRQLSDMCFIPSIESGIYQFDNNQFDKLGGSDDIPSQSTIAGICSTNKAEVQLIGTQFFGLFEYNDEKITAVDAPICDIIKKERLNKLIRLSSGDYVVGTILNGLYILDDDYEIKYHFNKNVGLKNNTILALFEDKDLNLWIGMDRGINLIELNSSSSQYYDREGILGTIYAAIYYENTLYLGTNQGLFYQNLQGNFELISNTQGQVWSLFEHKGNLICGHNNGTYKIEEQSAKIIADFTGGLDMLLLEDGTILQSTYTGLVRISLVENVYESERLESASILVRELIKNKELFYGINPDKGVYIFSLSSDLRRIEVLDTIDKSRFPSEKILAIKSIGNEAVLRTSSGFYRVTNKQVEKLENFTYANFLQLEIGDSYINVAITEVENWNSEIMYPIIFQESDGFSLRKKDGGGGQIGDCAIYIESINTGLGNLSFSNKATLSATDNNISIQLASKNLDWFPTQYLYRLADFDEAWQSIPSNGKISARNLDDAIYSFELQDMQTGESFVLGVITITPHWYESTWAYLIYLILCFALLYLLFKYQKRQIQKMENNLRHEQEKKLKQERVVGRNKQLEKEVKYKSKMLANNAMALIQKNNMLAELKVHVKKARETDDQREFQKIISLINRNMHGDEDWEIFEKNFAEVHEEFLDSLKIQHGNLTASELKLAAYIRMNLSSKEIAPLINISVRSVENKRYRLRKNLHLAHEDSLVQYLMRF